MQLELAPVQFSRILIATDFTPGARAALEYGLAIARQYSARVFMAHVVPAGRGERAVQDAWREAHTEVTNQLIAGHLQGVEHQVLVEQGEVWPVVEGMIARFGIDLLVTGTRGRTGLMKMLVGSTAEMLFRSANIPVLTVGPNASEGRPEGGPKRILLATGFGQKSLHAGGYALTLARQQGATLGLLHVVMEVADKAPERREIVERQALEKLRGLVPAEANLASAPEVFVSFDPVADSIVRQATEWRADLAVLGVRRPVHEARRVYWATAYSVVANAPCPVLTVRAPEV